MVSPELSVRRHRSRSADSGRSDRREPPNDQAHLPRRRGELELTKSLHAAAVRCSAWFGLGLFRDDDSRRDWLRGRITNHLHHRNYRLLADRAYGKHFALMKAKERVE